MRLNVILIKKNKIIIFKLIIIYLFNYKLKFKIFIYLFKKIYYILYMEGK